jgi:hypothetical protein
LPVEGKLGKKWIFLDDLMGTGRTFCRVWDAVHKIAGDRNFKTEYQGMFLYNDETFYEVNDRYNSTHCWLTNHSQRYNGEYFSEAADRRYNGRYDW